MSNDVKKKGMIFMKKSKLFKAVLTSFLCIMCLSGCVGHIFDLSINMDETGTYTRAMGFTQEGLDIISSMDESGESAYEYTTTFEYNGVKYYGEEETVNFSDLDELNVILNEGDTESTVDKGIFNVVKNEDNTFTMTMEVTDETGNTDRFKEELNSEGEFNEEELSALLEEMALVINVKFPQTVTQTMGTSDGITIDTDKLSIDVMKIKPEMSQTGTAVYKFKTVAGTEVASDSKIKFNDVLEGSWYYDAVYAMAEAGVVEGVEDDMFFPEETLTYAQLCQVLARVKGLDMGEQNGYWAYKAIQSCVEKGYIINKGEYNSQYYDVPVLREAAVSAMYKSKSDSIEVGEEIKETDIPDYALIDDVYKADILGAYNAKISTGTDENGTFNPKGILTRAELCQLFYNIGLAK